MIYSFLPSALVSEFIATGVFFLDIFVHPRLSSMAIKPFSLQPNMPFTLRTKQKKRGNKKGCEWTISKATKQILLMNNKQQHICRQS